MSGKEGAKVEEGKGRKLAIIMITTHGGISSLEKDKKNHDGKITVHKINATSDSVCNFTSPGGLNEMIGQRMNGYIADMITRERDKCDGLEAEYNSDNIFIATVLATVVASHTVEGFGTEALLNLNIDNIYERYEKYIKLIGQNTYISLDNLKSKLEI